jgi:hypothetical protein
MPSLPASRTTRRLLKVASLGLAGLLAGLLSGCTSSNTVSASTHSSSDSAYSTSADEFSQLPQSLDARQIPALRHPPSARRLYYGSVPNSHPQLLSVGRDQS